MAGLLRAARPLPAGVSVAARRAHVQGAQAPPRKGWAQQLRKGQQISWRQAAQAGGSSEEESAGSQEVQDRLVDILNVQMDYQKVKDKVEEESAKLEATAQELRDEIDRTQERQREERDASILEAMEKLDELSRQAEEELKARPIFQNVEDDIEEFEAWEAKMQEERSEGQFFKQLYVDKNRKGSYTMTKEEMKAKAMAIKRQANQQLRNPMRMVLYAFLTLVLTVASVEDMFTESPAWGIIALYLTIAGSMGFMGYQEMKYLQTQELEEQDSPDLGPY